MKKHFKGYDEKLQIKPNSKHEAKKKALPDVIVSGAISVL
jgi:hypothetical protein